MDDSKPFSAFMYSDLTVPSLPLAKVTDCNFLRLQGVRFFVDVYPEEIDMSNKVERIMHIISSGYFCT